MESFIGSASLKPNNIIDSLQVSIPDESIESLKLIGVSAKQSNVYDDEIEIQNIDNKTQFIEWLNKEHIKLSIYPRLRRYLKSK
jgi:hypothetical protein